MNSCSSIDKTAFRITLQNVNDNGWQNVFQELWDRGLQTMRRGRVTPDSLFGEEDQAFLSSIGCTPRELFDFVEDHHDFGEPDYHTVLAVTELRRDYFLQEQQGKAAGRSTPMSALPPKHAEADGIPWLPRIIAKARLKLRGEMPPDLMYGCGGDRAFLARVQSTLPEFLALVREHDGKDRSIIEAVKRRAVD